MTRAVMSRRTAAKTAGDGAVDAIDLHPGRPLEMEALLSTLGAVAGNYMLHSKGLRGSEHHTLAEGLTGQYKPVVPPVVTGYYLVMSMPEAREKSWVTSFFLGLSLPPYMALLLYGRSAAMAKWTRASQDTLALGRRPQARLPWGAAKLAWRLARRLAARTAPVQSSKAVKWSETRLRARPGLLHRPPPPQGEGQVWMPTAATWRVETELRPRLMEGWYVKRRRKNAPPRLPLPRRCMEFKGGTRRLGPLASVGTKLRLPTMLESLRPRRGSAV
jgi:hypothetical protein